MADKFDSFGDSPIAPGRRFYTITPHATNEIDPLPKAIRANDAGTVVLRAVDSGADETVTMAAGEVLEVRARYIRVTGTTVTKIQGIA